MSQMLDESFIGKGELHAAVKVAGQLEYFFLGNCSNLSLQPNENTITLRDYTRPGGGNRASHTTIDSLGISMTLHEFRKKVLEVAARATSSAKSKETITEESVTAKLDSFVALDEFADPATIVVEKDGVLDPYVAGVDYQPRPGGIYFLKDGDIADNASLKVTYDTLPHTKVEALTATGANLAMKFIGINEVTGKAVNVSFHNVRFGLSGLDFISDEFAEFSLEGEVQADPSILTAGVSRFYKLEMQD